MRAVLNLCPFVADWIVQSFSWCAQIQTEGLISPEHDVTRRTIAFRVKLLLEYGCRSRSSLVIVSTLLATAADMSPEKSDQSPRLLELFWTS